MDGVWLMVSLLQWVGGPWPGIVDHGPPAESGRMDPHCKAYQPVSDCAIQATLRADTIGVKEQFQADSR